MDLVIFDFTYNLKHACKPQTRKTCLTTAIVTTSYKSKYDSIPYVQVTRKRIQINIFNIQLKLDSSKVSDDITTILFQNETPVA